MKRRDFLKAAMAMGVAVAAPVLAVRGNSGNAPQGHRFTNLAPPTPDSEVLTFEMIENIRRKMEEAAVPAPTYIFWGNEIIENPPYDPERYARLHG